MRPVILLDCDGVLADFVGALCTELVFVDHSYLPQDFKEWDLTKTLSQEAALDMAFIMKQRHFCRDIEPYPGARKFVDSLRELGDVVCVTAPHKASAWWMQERVAWLEHEVGIKQEDVIFTGRKGLVMGDFLIEDSAKNASDWTLSMLERSAPFCRGEAIVIDRPWNASAPLTGGIYRESSYGTILSTIESITKGRAA